MGHLVRSNPSATTFTITHNVASPTSLRSFLLGTAAYMALPGAPAPDDIIPANFIKIATDTSIEYNPWDTGTWPLGLLPTNGIASLQRPGTGMPLAVVTTNSPKNYANVTGSIDASGGGGALPGVPDGSSLSVTWDVATCSDTNNHQILYGQKSGFPSVPGGVYSLQGGTCSIGSTSPYTWTSTPNAIDGNGLIWFLLVTKTASGIEGPWGDYSGSAERNGPGAGGSSDECATTDKSLAGTCGH